jgi:hypothetical protein
MAPSETEIRSLLTSQSYSASSVAPLEEYLAAQVAGEAPYVFDAVRTLIKLYQLFPETCNEQNIGRGYMLALLEYPNTDLLALSYMVPQPILDKEYCATIQICASQLNSCKFTDFWKTFESLQKSGDAGIQSLAKRSVKRMQESVVQVLALTYKNAPVAVVLTALNIKSAGDITALKSAAVESVDSEKVVFVPTVDNTKRQRVYQEAVDFSTISNLLMEIAQ